MHDRSSEQHLGSCLIIFVNRDRAISWAIVKDGKLTVYFCCYGDVGSKPVNRVFQPRSRPAHKKVEQCSLVVMPQIHPGTHTNRVDRVEVDQVFSRVRTWDILRLVLILAHSTFPVVQVPSMYRQQPSLEF